MAKSMTENACIDFRIQLSSLKAITGYSDKKLAEYIGCSVRTLEKMRASPLEVSGKYILMTQALLAKEDARRRI